jgi:hypothetical protein
MENFNFTSAQIMNLFHSSLSFLTALKHKKVIYITTVLVFLLDKMDGNDGMIENKGNMLQLASSNFSIE